MVPSGRKRFFVHRQHRGKRVWKIIIDAAEMSVKEARSPGAETLAAIRRSGNTPSSPKEALFEAVARSPGRRS